MEPAFRKSRGWWGRSVVAVVPEVVCLTPVKQSWKCSNEHFLLLLLTQKSGLVKWIFAKGYFSSLSLMLLAIEALKGVLFKAFGFETGLKVTGFLLCAHQTALEQALLGDVRQNISKSHPDKVAFPKSNQHVSNRLHQIEAIELGCLSQTYHKLMQCDFLGRICPFQPGIHSSSPSLLPFNLARGGFYCLSQCRLFQLYCLIWFWVGWSRRLTTNTIHFVVLHLEKGFQRAGRNEACRKVT